MFRIRIFKFYLILFALTSPLVLHAIPIEEALRAYQSRRETLGISPAQFTIRPDGVAPPAYPADGFYGDYLKNPIFAASLVRELASRVTSIIGSFVAAPEGNIQGLTRVPHYSIFHPDTPSVTGITPSNYMRKFYIIQRQLSLLTHIDVLASQDDKESKEVLVAGNDRCMLAGCEIGFQLINQAYGSVNWGTGFAVSPVEGCQNGGPFNPGLGHIAVVTTSGSSSYGLFVDSLNTRGKIRADLSRFQGGGTGKVFLKVARLGVVAHNPPSNAPSGTFGEWAGGRPILGTATWKSDFVSESEVKPEGVCLGGAQGWSLDDQVVIVKPVFQESPTDSCPPCKGEGCVVPTEEGKTGSVDFKIGLGSTFKGSAGSLYLKSDRPDPILYSPLGLTLDLAPEVQIIYGSTKILRQIFAPETFADIVVISPSKYEIRFYTPANAGIKNPQGFYEPQGTAYHVLTIENPDPASANHIQITRNHLGDIKVSQYSYDVATSTWEYVSGGGLRQESVSSIWSADRRTKADTYEVKNASGDLISKEKRTYFLFPFGEKMIERVIDPDGAMLKTTWTYETDTASTSYGLLKQKVEPKGYWERYEYDANRRVIKLVNQYLNAPVSSPEIGCRVITTTYSDIDPAITRIENLLGQEVSRSYTVDRPGETWEIQANAPGASWDDPNNLVTKTVRYLGTQFQNELQSVKNPDGTMTFYEYSIAGNQKTTTMKSGQPNSTGTDIIDGTRTVRVTNLAGSTLSEITTDILTGLVLNITQVSQVDEFGRPIIINYNDGTSTQTRYGCCGIDSITDREGIVTTYIYDDLKRVIASARAGITILTTYDAEGRILTIKRQGSDGSQIPIKTVVCDIAGRLTSIKDALLNTTIFTETIDGSGQTVRTTTFPNSATKIETFYQDGQLQSVSGTGVHPLQYLHGVDSSGIYSIEIRIGNGGTTTEWTKSYSDFLGRIHKIVQADGTVSSSYFNNLGQLIKQTDSDGVTTLFSYNGKGQHEYSALDINQDGVINFNGTDRITKIENTIATARETTVHRTTTSVYTTDGANSTSTTSIQEISADGLMKWDTQFGLLTETHISYDGAGGRTMITTDPDGTTTTSNYANGRLVSFVTQNSELGTLNSISNSYDVHGRQSSITDIRSGKTSFEYNDADQFISITTPPPSPGILSQTTLYQYDNMGRRSLVTLPDNGVMIDHYFDTGELKDTSGARTYSTAYTYDSQGRLSTLTAGTDITTWNYDPLRGLLTSKLYPDTKGPSYTYTPAGRLKTKISARGIITTYNYNSAGEISGITYSDSTPDVIYTYDRRGRRIEIRTPQSEIHNAFNEVGQLLTEEHISGPLDGIIVTNAYDNLLRRNTLSTSLYSQPLTLNTFSYAPTSRLQTVSDDHGNNVTYTYFPNSSLIDTLTFKKGSTTMMTTSREYDNLNRLTQISSSFNSQLSTFNYSYNDANQRTRIDLVDDSYWIYSYDNLGQVISGKKYWSDGVEVDRQQFDYEFDDIGNRTISTRSSKPETRDLQQETYSSNNLNQYSQRTVPGAVDVIGTATANATVTVNNQPVTRKGDYFSKQLSVDNSVGPVYQSIDVVGVKNNAGPNGEDAVTENIGSVYIPQTPEVYTYDEDGNLTSDGRWQYSWDAENRLVAVEGAGSIPASAKKRLEFTYDHQNRRIQKKVYTWNSSTLNFELRTSNSFVYDGFTCIAELDSDGSLLRSYTWGQTRDLLLVSISNSSLLTSNLFAICDANNNLISLVDATTGNISASYEYSPFGELIRAEGLMAKANPIRFSSQYQDSETGLLYYGYRYYNPSSGKWLSREPLGEHESPNLYNFVSNNAVNHFDVLGLYQEDGHFYTTYMVARAAGYSTQDAYALAYYSQVPDEVVDYSAFVSTERTRNDLKKASSRKNLEKIQNYLHSLHGEDSVERRDCLRKLLGNPLLSNMERGLLIHAFADSYSHSLPYNENGVIYDDFDPQVDEYPETAYGFPIGHGIDSAIGADPDLISRRPELFKQYTSDLFGVLSGGNGDISHLDPFFKTVDNYSSFEASHLRSQVGFRRLAKAQYGYDKSYAPEFFRPELPINKSQSPDAQGLKVLTQQDIDNLLQKIRKYCCDKK